MNRQIIHKLEKLGFSRHEAKIWRAALTIGDAELSALAKAADIPRTSAYGAIGRLLERGLLEYYMKKRRRHYVPVFPDQLVHEFKNKAESAQKLVPELRLLAKSDASVPQITLHEGVDGVRYILNHIIEYKHNLVAIASIEDMEAVVGEKFEEFIAKRIKRRLRVRFLTNQSNKAKGLARGDSGALRETRFLPSVHEINTATYIFGHHVAFLSLRPSRTMAVLIHDKDIATTQQTLFELLWKSAQKV